VAQTLENRGGEAQCHSNSVLIQDYLALVDMQEYCISGFLLEPERNLCWR